MNKDILIEIIQNDDNLENYQKDFLSDMWKMASAWKQLGYELLSMDISEKTEIKIHKILANIGDEMIKICEIMISENNK